MKRRLMCLALCIMMLLTLALTSCSNTTDTEDETTDTTTTTTTSKKAMTIVLNTITDKSTTPEAIEAVQAAINEITHSEYNTNVILRMWTEDEYDKMVDETIEGIETRILEEEEAAKIKKAEEKAAREAARAAGETTTTTKATEEETEETDETFINAYGFEQTLYPEEKGTQFDIFLVRDLENYKDYIDRGVVSALDEQLSIGAKILKQYIHPSFLSAAMIGGRTYAIPNNRMVGEYQYMLVNKELVDKYYYDPDDFKDVTDIQGFLDEIIKYEPDYIPLLNEPEQRIEYISDTASILGSYVAKSSALGVPAAPKNLLSVSQFTNLFKMVNKYKAGGNIAYDGYIGDGNKYAAAIITGDYSTPAMYEEEYYVSVYKYPTAKNDNMYNGMYAVSTYASDVSRCMEVITALTTNETLINIMTYGVANVHYEIDEISGKVRKLNNDYSMNPNYTGNQFLKWQSEDMDEQMTAISANKWELAKAQNLDIVYSGYLGFTFAHQEEVRNEDGTRTVQNIKVHDMTIQEIIDGVVRDTQGYLDRILAFEEYDYEETVIKKVRVRNATTGELRDEEREEIVTKTFTVDDFMAELSAEVNENIYVAAALDTEEENSILSQYTTWQSGE